MSHILKKAKKVSTLCYFLYYNSQTLIDLGAYARLEKTWAEISSQRQDRIVAILKKCVLKQVIEGGQKKSKILSIPNKYKDTLEDLVDSLDVEHPAILRQIDLPSDDIPGSKNDPSNPEIDDDLLDRSQGQQQYRITPPPSWVPRAVMRG